MPFEGELNPALPSGIKRNRSMKSFPSTQLIVAVVAVSACASFGKPVPSRTELSVNVKAPQSRTLDAVRAAFYDAGFSLDTSQHLPGVVPAEPATIAWEGGRFSVCSASRSLSSIYPDFGGGEVGTGSASGVHVGFSHEVPMPYVSTFTVTVQGDSLHSTVLIAGKWRAADGKPMKCELSRYWQDEFAEQIKWKSETHTSFWHKAQP
jgi:hypothetical protein